MKFQPLVPATSQEGTAGGGHSPGAGAWGGGSPCRPFPWPLSTPTRPLPLPHGLTELPAGLAAGEGAGHTARWLSCP